MSTVNANAKKETANKVNQISLKSITDKLQNVTLEVKKERVNLYIYPQDLNTEALRNGKKGKAFRRKLRTLLEKHCNNILIFIKYDRKDDLKNEIVAFKKFYKENYRINDFTVTSVSQSAKDEKTNYLQMMFDVIKLSEEKKK